MTLEHDLSADDLSELRERRIPTTNGGLRRRDHTLLVKMAHTGTIPSEPMRAGESFVFKPATAENASLTMQHQDRSFKPAYQMQQMSASRTAA